MNFFGRKKGQGGATTKGSAGPRGGGGGGGGTPSAAESLTALRGRISALDKRIEFLEKKAQANLVAAKRFHGAKQKSKAMTELARKRMHEKEIDKLRVSVANLEQQAFAIENASTSIDIVNGLKIARQANQDIQKQINVEDIETLREDIEEQMGIQEEVNELLSTNMYNDMDEDDLLAELDELDDEIGLGDDDILNELAGEAVPAPKAKSKVFTPPSSSVNLPVAPSATPVRRAAPVEEEDEDARALAALQAEMEA